MSNARTLANTINSSSEIVVPSGGVNFGNSTDGSGTVTGGVLDDYEEGTWTPVLSAGFTTTGTVTITGGYTKIGRIVTCWFQIRASTVSGSNARLTGQPFTIGSDSLYARGHGFFGNDASGYPSGGILAFRSGVYLENFSINDISGSFTYEAA